MKQTLRIQFEEQAKGVVANVDLEWTDVAFNPSEEQVFLQEINNSQLAEAKRLFEQAQAYAHTKTLQKNR